LNPEDVGHALTFVLISAIYSIRKMVHNPAFSSDCITKIMLH